jgi:putative transposase
MPGKRYNEDQIFSALRRVEEGEKIKDVCRNLGVSEQTFFRWKTKYAGMSRSDLQRAKQLEAENARLKRLLAERELEIDAMKEVLQKKW